jgi:hypothetical protein
MAATFQHTSGSQGAEEAVDKRDTRGSELCDEHEEGLQTQQAGLTDHLPSADMGASTGVDQAGNSVEPKNLANTPEPVSAIHAIRAAASEDRADRERGADQATANLLKSIVDNDERGNQPQLAAGTALIGDNVAANEAHQTRQFQVNIQEHAGQARQSFLGLEELQDSSNAGARQPNNSRDERAEHNQRVLFGFDAPTEGLDNVSKQCRLTAGTSGIPVTASPSLAALMVEPQRLQFGVERLSTVPFSQVQAQGSSPEPSVPRTGFSIQMIGDTNQRAQGSPTPTPARANVLWRHQLLEQTLSGSQGQAKTLSNTTQQIARDQPARSGLASILTASAAKRAGHDNANTGSAAIFTTFAPMIR